MSVHHGKENSYVPREFNGDEMTPREKAIAKSAFEAGREYEASLFSNVLSVIVQEVKRYRAATKEGSNGNQD